MANEYMETEKARKRFLDKCKAELRRLENDLRVKFHDYPLKPAPTIGEYHLRKRIQSLRAMIQSLLNF